MQGSFAMRCLTALFVLLLAGAGNAENLVVSGSGNPEYVLRMLAEEFNSQQTRHRVSVPTSSGTAGAIRDVLADKTTLARVGRPLKEEERSRGLTYIPVGRDAVVFVAGAGVSLSGVSSAQMVDAYAGKISDWSELGAAPAPIRAIGREVSDASRRAIMGYIEAFRDIEFGPGIKLVHLDPQMIEVLDRFPSSLGMLNRSALFAAKTKVVPLAIDGVEPTPANLASGAYPMALEFGLIHKTGNAPSGAARAFLEFIKSPEGERILRAHGVAPIATNQ